MPGTNTKSSAAAADRPLLYFAGMGAIGGLCAFVLSRMAGAGPFVSSPFVFDLLTEILLGSVAALFGVYMLTASDCAKNQTLVFALACGVSWSPVFTAAKVYVNIHTDNATTSHAKDASVIANQISTQQGDTAEDSKRQAAQQIGEAIQKIPSLSSTAARQQVVNSSKEVVNSLANSKPDSASVEALKNIGLTSIKTDSAQVSLLTFNRLRQLAIEPSVSEATRIDAQKAAHILANSDPALPKVVLPNKIDGKF